jgi:hypothetical protein
LLISNICSNYLYHTGNVYERYYIDDAKSGDGTYLWKNGQKFVGTFEHNAPAKGTFTYSPDAPQIKYEGEFRDWKFHGMVFIYDIKEFVQTKMSRPLSRREFRISRYLTR